jgi:Tfp pilus assembly protein PilV
VTLTVCRKLWTFGADERGMGVVEVLVAATVLVAALLGTLAMVDVANSTTSRTIAREGATTLARDLVERTRQVPFAQHGTADFGRRVAAALTAAGETVTSTDGSTFSVVRRDGTTYTARVASCKVDDPTDGIGPHDATFCDFAQTPAAGNPDPQAPPAVSATLKLLGLPVAVNAGGALLDSVCRLLGANAVGSVPALDALLGRGGAVDRLTALAGSGADVDVCPDGTTREKFAVDRSAADFSKVTVTVRWRPRGEARDQQQTQSTLIPNPT